MIRQSASALVFGVVFSSCTTPDSDVTPHEPSPNDPRMQGVGTTGTPGSAGVTGTGTGLGTGTNATAETTARPNPRSQPPSVGLTAEGVDLRPTGGASNLSPEGGTIENTGPVRDPAGLRAVP